MTDQTAELTAVVPQPDYPAAAPPAYAPPSMPVPVPGQPLPRLPESDAGAQSVTCPGCATIGYADPGQRESQAFCRVCDYPLFWARERITAPAGTEGSDDSLRRLPGVVGRTALASISCPVCTEPNPYSATHCRRCNSELRPAAVVVVAPPPPAPLPPAPVVVRTRLWPWVLATVLASILLVVLAIVLLDEYGAFTVHFVRWYDPHVTF